jgi:colicin import membrane protein
MRDGGTRTAATAFTIAIHAALLVALVVSVSWKNTAPPPTVLSAELFSPKPAPPPPDSAPPPPTSAAPPVPEPKPAPAPPTPTADDADIAIKKQKEAEVKKLREKAQEEERAKLKAEEDRKLREKQQKQLEEAKTKERLRKEADRDATLRDLLAQANQDKQAVDRDITAQRRAAQDKAQRDAEAAARDTAAKNAAQKSAADAAADKRALADYINKIRNKVRSNLVFAQEVQGNPAAQFEITQLISGEVVSVQLRKSSGNRALDEAIERAVFKSSPLPKPDKPELFDRTLILQVRPND